jgi:hypothetical protein
MKAKYLKNMLAALAMGVLALGASPVTAQDSSAPTTVMPAAAAAPAPQLAYGVPQVLQLSQAKVGDDTIIAYIKNSGNSYGLNADQIIYLRQQGLSDAVITTMLNQPKPAVMTTYTPGTPAPQPAAAPAVAAVPTPTPAPSVTYVQSVPATAYYYQPQPYYYPAYYPAYSAFPAVSLSFGWGSGWGGYYRGGYGGYYGGWHGGGYGGWHGGYGGWHGGYGGWHH